MLYCITAIGHGPMLVNDQSLKCCTLTWQPLPQFLLELILIAPGQFSATFLPVQYKIECTVCPTFLAPPTDPDVQRTCSIVHYESSSTWLYQSYTNVPCSKKKRNSLHNNIKLFICIGLCTRISLSASKCTHMVNEC